MNQKSFSFGTEYLAKLLLLFLLYFGTAHLGLMMDAINGFAALVWPPTGIALAALLLFGSRLWPAITIAAFLVNFKAGAAVSAAAGIAIGNTIEALLAAYLLRRKDFNPNLSRLQDAMWLVIYGALVSTAVGASIGISSLLSFGSLDIDMARPTWLAWWLGDAVGALILAPLLLVSSIKSTKSAFAAKQNLFEVIAFFLVLIAIGFVLFSEPSSFLATAPLPFIVFPTAIWTALRFGVKWSTRTVFVISSAAILSTTMGLGPFVRQPLSEGLALLHFFIGAVAVTSLILVAAVSERVHASELVKENAERATAEERIKTILNTAYDAFISMNADGLISDWNPQAAALFGWERSEALGKNLGDLIVPEQFREGHHQGLRRFLKTCEGPMIGRRIELPAIHRSGKEIPIELTISFMKNSDEFIFNAFLHDVSHRKRAELIQETRLAFTRILTEATTTTEAFERSLETICLGLNWDYGCVWLLDDKKESLLATTNWFRKSSNHLDKLTKINHSLSLQRGRGIPGVVWQSNDAVWINDLSSVSNLPRALMGTSPNLQGAAAFPIVSGSDFIGVIEFMSHETLEPNEELSAAMTDIGGRLGLFVQRKRAEEKSRQSDERYRHLIDAVKDYAIIMLDPDGLVASWNSGAQKIMGYSASEIIGKHFSKFYPPEAIAAGSPEHELEAAQAIGRYQEEGWRIRKSGIKFHANVTVTPLYDATGKIYGFSKVTRDITERRAAEESLIKLNDELEKRVEERTAEAWKREKQLQLIADALPTIVSEFDAEGRFRFVNEACRKWFESQTNHLLGMTLEELFGPESYGVIKEHELIALSGREASFEYETSQNGKKLILSVSFVPEFNEQGQPNGFIAVATDVTKHYEAKEAAETASKAKSAFLANMSHEIRTPLGAVLGFSELLSNQNLTPAERSKYVSAIKRNGDLLSNIISDILDISKVEAEKLEVDSQQVPLVEVLTDITTMLSLQAQDKGLRLTVTSDGPIPRHIVTDALRLRQILINIVGNAIKFTQRGFVEVKIRQLETPESQTKIAFDVKDSGPGIDPEQAIKLFQAFTQADISTKRKYGGTGLGLVLSRRLANLLGGDVILAESTVGAGSTFTITINPGPIRDQVINAFAKQAPELHDDPALPLTKKDEARLRGLRILLVEDAPDNQMLIGRFLKVAGADVELANNGKEALDKTNLGNYDVILMDLQMPIMDGYEATTELRKNGYEKPIIALTAHALKEERQRCLASGFNDHIGKPVNRTILLDSILYQCSKNYDAKV